MHDLPQFHTFKLNLQKAFSAYAAIKRADLKAGIPYRLAQSSGLEKINDVLRKQGEFFMAKGKRPTNTAYSIQWVRVELTEQEAETFQAWNAKGAPDLYDLLSRMLAEGDKISVTYSEKSDCFYCTVMGSENSHRNEGKGFTSYASSPEMAIALAVWKYWNVLTGDMSEGSSSERPAFG